MMRKNTKQQKTGGVGYKKVVFNAEGRRENIRKEPQRFFNIIFHKTKKAQINLRLFNYEYVKTSKRSYDTQEFY